MVRLSRKNHKVKTVPQAGIGYRFRSALWPDLKGEKWKTVENYGGFYQS